MTKLELIKFLEPFSDEIEIDFNPKYVNENGLGLIKNFINSAQGENSNVSNNEDEKEEFIKLCMCSNPEYKDGKCINCGDADWEFE